MLTWEEVQRQIADQINHLKQENAQLRQENAQLRHRVRQLQEELRASHKRMTPMQLERSWG